MEYNSTSINGYGPMNSPDFLNGLGSSINSTWFVISLIIALIVAILVFFIFLSKKNENRFLGFGKWLYEFWNFRKLFLEGFLKFVYLFSAFFITLYSFSVIGDNFGVFLLIIIGGNILLRCFYELTMMMLIICRNTNEINAKTVKYDDPYVNKNDNIYVNTNTNTNTQPEANFNTNIQA